MTHYRSRPQPRARLPGSLSFWAYFPGPPRARRVPGPGGSPPPGGAALQYSLLVNTGTIEEMRVRPFNGQEWERQYPQGHGEYDR